MIFTLILSIFGILFCLWLLITIPYPITTVKVIAVVLTTVAWIFLFALDYSDLRIAHIHPTTTTTITVVK